MVINRIFFQEGIPKIKIHICCNLHFYCNCIRYTLSTNFNIFKRLCNVLEILKCVKKVYLNYICSNYVPMCLIL